MPLNTVTSVALLAADVVAIEVSESCGMGVILFEKEDGENTVVDRDSRPGAVVMADAAAAAARTCTDVVSLMVTDSWCSGLDAVLGDGRSWLLI